MIVWNFILQILLILMLLMPFWSLSQTHTLTDKEMIEIDSLFQRKSSADVKNILEAFLNPIDGPSVDDVGISSVDEAIRELSA